MPADKSPVIAIENVHFYRGEKCIFDGISLEIMCGSITSIMGPSGTGKTTLLKLITGQLQPKSGQIMVEDLSVPDLSRRELYQLRRRMSLLFQAGGLFTDLSVFENVAFPLRQHTQLPDDMIHDIVLMILEAVGLRGAANLRIDQLSGGMARRVALARAVILGPEIMLYDEPFSGQDPIGRGVLLKLIKDLNDALGLTSVMVSHDVEETAKIADYVFIIFKGKVIGQGTPQQLLQDPSPEVQQFIQGLPDGSVSFQYPANSYQEDLYLS